MSVMDEWNERYGKIADQQAIKQCEENMEKESMRNWDYLARYFYGQSSDALAQAKLAAKQASDDAVKKQQAMLEAAGKGKFPQQEYAEKLAADQAIGNQMSGGDAANDLSLIPYEYREYYRRAEMENVDWSSLFRQVVEELGARDRMIKKIHAELDRIRGVPMKEI